MVAAAHDDATLITVRGIGLETCIQGTGRDILFLNSGSWLANEAPFVKALATLGRVVAPIHPGFGSSDVPPELTTVDDLAYLYLDLIDELQLQSVLLIGASFGGWVAAEMAIKSDLKLAALALIGPLGIKAGTRDERTIADMFSIPDADIEARSYATPQAFHRDVKDLSDRELTSRIRSREALARFGWSPYMHNPKLPSRLHRTKVPATVMWGEKDRMVAEACGRTYAEGFPSGRFVQIDGAAHLPHLEQPDRVLLQLNQLLGDNGAHQSIRSREAV